MVWGGWELFLYWDKVKNEEETKQKQEAAAMVIGDQLPGLPYQLEGSLQAARKQGAAGLKNWLKTHSQSIEDPRKAWIELDYCVAVAREDLGGSQARLRGREGAHAAVLTGLAADQATREDLSSNF